MQQDKTPRTAAGRALLATLQGIDPRGANWLTLMGYAADRILAIEAEAAQAAPLDIFTLNAVTDRLADRRQQGPYSHQEALSILVTMRNEARRSPAQARPADAALYEGEVGAPDVLGYSPHFSDRPEDQLRDAAQALVDRWDGEMFIEAEEERALRAALAQQPTPAEEKG